LRKKVAIAFGSFDILHPGHLHYLRSASRYGRLVVVVARDESIRKLKGKPPLMSERSRLEIIKSLRFVDTAVLGDRIRRWNDIYRVLARYRPGYIVLGYDQKVDREYLGRFLKENGLRSRIVRIGPYRSATFKSSRLKEAAKRLTR
jgi:FAD synthetase